LHVRPADPPEGERIIAGSIFDYPTLTSSGAFEPLTAESTKPVAEVRRHVGITRVLRWRFGLG
jgi:hypothetical protein